MHVSCILEEKADDVAGKKKILQEIMAENYANLIKDIDLQIPEVQQTPHRTDTKQATPGTPQSNHINLRTRKKTREPRQKSALLTRK